MNIWATILGLIDQDFVSSNKEDLHLSICHELGKVTNQTWMMHTCAMKHATTALLYKEGYPLLKSSEESFLVLVLPGFADVRESSLDLQGVALEELCKAAQVFEKRVLYPLLGCPQDTPQERKGKILSLNRQVENILERYEGVPLDLREISFADWRNGCKPQSLQAVSEIVVEAVLGCHAGIEKWRKLHER